MKLTALIIYKPAACPIRLPGITITIELGARIFKGSLRSAQVFKDRQNPLVFTDTYLYKRYRFSREGSLYL